MIAAALTLFLAPVLFPIEDEELARRLAEAGDDVALLWDVRVWLEGQGRTQEGGAVLAAILELDPDHALARAALAHHAYDGRWFESYTELSRYRRDEERRMAERGLVRWRDGWAPTEHLAWLRLGFVEQLDGSWLHPGALARRAEDAAHREAGWQRQDLTWISPEELESAQAGLWKCGERWLSLEEADRYHAELHRWWRVAGERFVVHTTLPRAAQAPEWAAWWADRTWNDLVRIFGVEPRGKPVVVVLDGIEQYNALAVGDPAAGLAPTELEGSSSVHYAFFAEAWLEDLGFGPEYQGCGVGWWDRDDPALAPFGQHSVRHAAAQSFVEAIDPSWNTVGAMVADGLVQAQVADFWAEKRIPRWLRYGAAAYVERYFVDDTVGEGGDPLWARKWATANLAGRGGPADLERVLEFALSAGDAAGSADLIQSAGLVVAFVLDGGDAEVAAAHAALRDALVAGDDTRAPVAALEQALRQAEEQIAAFGR
jgi:hypothetical protein